MGQILELNWLPCDLNTYIQKERSNRFLGAKIKKEETETIAWVAKAKLKPIKKPVRMYFKWIAKNKKKDPDNICFARKFILDALVLAKILENDGWKNIKGFADDFEIGKEEKVIIDIV